MHWRALFALYQLMYSGSLKCPVTLATIPGAAFIQLAMGHLIDQWHLTTTLGTLVLWTVTWDFSSTLLPRWPVTHRHCLSLLLNIRVFWMSTLELESLETSHRRYCRGDQWHIVIVWVCCWIYGYFECPHWNLSHLRLLIDAIAEVTSNTSSLFEFAVEYTGILNVHIGTWVTWDFSSTLLPRWPVTHRHCLSLLLNIRVFWMSTLELESLETSHRRYCRGDQWHIVIVWVCCWIFGYFACPHWNCSP